MTPLQLALLSPLALAADDPRALAAEAAANNPEIAALEERVSELDHLARVADTWPDPVLGAELSNLPASTWTLDGHPMAGLQLRAAQTIPFPGVTGLRRDVAEARVGVAQARLAEARLQLARAVEVAYWRLALVRRLREITERHVALADDLLGAVRARYETGGAAQHELVRMEVLRDRLRDDLDDFEEADRRLTAAIDRALHREPTAPVDTPDDIAPLEVAGEPAAWLRLALDRRPLLRQHEAEEEAARLSARLARVDARPDLTVWAGWRVRAFESDADPGTDLASLGVSVPVPVGSARAGRGREAAARSEAEGARRRREAAVDAIAEELERAYATWSRAADKARTYTDELLPAARRALETTFSDYRVGRADFSALYQAEIQLLDLERAEVAAAAETRIQDAVVRAATGAPVGTPEDGAPR